ASARTSVTFLAPPSRSAAALGISRATLHRKLNRLDLHRSH
ncbi:MAG: hypothetical protein E5Y32_22680, partial [Mesorhizobium sp.]